MNQPMKAILCTNLVLASVGVLIAQSANQTNVTIGSSPHPNIAIASAATGSLAASLFSGSLTNLQPACMLVTNNDSRAVVAARVIWTVTSSAGKQTKHRYSSDNIANPKLPSVVSPGGVILIAPRTWLPQEHFGSVSPSTLTVLQQFADRFAGATAISVQLDAVIFADGQIAGPGGQQYGSELTARKQAAIYVAKAVTDALSAGQSPSTILSQIAASNHSSTTNFDLSFWEYSYANELLHATPSTLNPRLAELTAMRDATSLSHQ